MDNTISIIEPLLEKAEKFGKTSVELLKLKAVNKTADITSSLLSGLMFAIILSFFAFILSIATALWLSDLLGKNYYGFVIVAAFYGLIGIITFFIHPFIKKQFNNLIITQVLK